MLRYARGVHFAFVLGIVVTACGGGGGGGGGGPAGLSVTTTSLPSGTEGVPYSAALSAANGSPPYTWILSAGSLPQGLSLSAAGVISGTPLSPTNASFTVRVSDSAVPQNNAERILSILIVPSPLRIVNTFLSDGHATVPYVEQLQATGGVQPYSWSSTALPPGLSLSPSGLLSGTPTNPGTTPVTFTVTDARVASVSQTLSITINASPVVSVSGVFMFDKVPATTAGLDFASIYTTAVRACFVGLEDQANPGVFFSFTLTSASGSYSLPSPQNTTVKLYLFALHASPAGSIKVVDRASASSPKPIWGASTPAIAVGTVNVTGSNWNVPDSTRINGPFNIVDVVYSIQQTVLNLNPSSSFGDATIEFSPNFYPGTSYFQGSTGFIKGDRNIDSDDFDDAVIAHEYSHYLQTRFSRDDSTGGTHALNQLIDPRVAMGEGMATFLGQAFLADSVYIDTSSGGASVTNLENATTILPGYWNELSVMKTLWDCHDAPNEPGDTLTLPLGSFWNVFTLDMSGHTLTYLIDFMDSLTARNPARGAAIASILSLEGITYTPGGSPSVPNPWPPLLQSGVPASAFLDASIDQQWNLLFATDVFYFAIPSGRSVTVSVTHTGEGPSPAEPDFVNFYVFNDTGHGYFPNGELFAAGYAPAVFGTGYTHSQTFTLASGGTYGVVATSCYPYPPSAAPSPTLFSSADYQVTATY